MHNSKLHVWVVVLSVRTGSCWRQLHVKAPPSRRALKIHPPAEQRGILRGRAFKIELTLNRTNKPLLKSLYSRRVKLIFTWSHISTTAALGGGRLWIKLFKSNHSLTLCRCLCVGILLIFSSCQETRRGKWRTFQCIVLTNPNGSIPETKRLQQTV